MSQAAGGYVGGKNNILRPNMLNLNVDVPITGPETTSTFADKRRTISLTSRDNLGGDFGTAQMRHTAGFSKKHFE